jgi:hypothetical protein
MTLGIINQSWRFWLLWAAAFIGFPIGGLLSNAIVGPITTPVQAAIAGAISGAILGLVQWFVLKGQLPLTYWWIIATSAGMLLGLAISTAFLGSETSGAVLLWRAAITGGCIGLAQWILLKPILPQAWIWVVGLVLAWVVGWLITRSAGVDLSLKWSVFGSSGAILFQVLTGLVLYVLVRLSLGVK